jgi:hypothetical protein
MPLEEFDAWTAAKPRVGELKETGHEVGGPQLSLVPMPIDVAPGPEPDNLDCPVIASRLVRVIREPARSIAPP